MNTHLLGFVNFEQKDWTRFLLIAEFADNNAKNLSTGYTDFELNCGFHLWVFHKEDIDLCSQSKIADKLSNKLRKRMIVCKTSL